MTAGAPVTITEPLRKLHQARRRSFVQSVSPLQPPPHKHLYRLLNSPSTAANFVAVSFVPQCFFLQYALPYMKTPYFILNTAYDVFQFHNKVQIATLQEFRRYMLETLRPFYMNSTRGGMFINSCFAHCQSESLDTWLAPDSPRVHNKVCLCELNIRLLEHSSSKSFVSATFILLGKASQKLLVIGTSAEV